MGWRSIGDEFAALVLLVGHGLQPVDIASVDHFRDGQCDIAVEIEAPCQCFLWHGHQTTSPGADFRARPALRIKSSPPR